MIQIKLNEEQQGLKLIQVNNGLVVVDCSKECYDDPKVWNYSTNTGFIFQGYRRSYGPDYDQSFEILFATANLKIKDVPVIEDKDETFLNQLANDFCDSFKPKDVTRSLHYSFKQGYKQSQQNLFTKGDLKLAILRGYELGKSGGSEMDRKAEEKYLINHLKQPRVEITFENDKPVKCVLL